MLRVLTVLRSVLGTVLALGAAIPLGSRLLEPYVGDPAPQGAAFATVALPLWLLATLLLIGRSRSRRVVTVLMVAVLAVQVWWWLPSAQARAASQPAPGGVPFVLMTQNAEIGAADADRIVAAAVTQRADLLVVTELTPELAERLAAAGLDRQLPYRNLHPGQGAAGTGTWSRWPVHAMGMVPGLLFAAPRTVVDVPGGQPLTVNAVHPQALRPGHLPDWRRELAALAADARTTTGARIYVGDFNAGSAHSGFRAITATGLADAADSHGAAGGYLPTGWGFTWPADEPGPPVTRIDHVLVTPSAFAVRATRTVAVPGTDHRGLVADLTLRPATQG